MYRSQRSRRIVEAWEQPQRERQEVVPIDDPALQAFLATPVGQRDVPGGEEGRWS